MVERDTIRQLGEVRREVWKGGGVGLAVGLAFGVVVHWGTKVVPQLRGYRSPNTRFATVFLFGAFGSFLGATVRGSNALTITDIFLTSKR